MKKQELEIQKQISPIIREVQSIEIKDKESMSDAVIVLSKLNKFSDNVESEKLKLTRPLNEAIKEVRLRYRNIEQTLSESILALKGKISTYQTEAIARETKEQEAIANKVIAGKLSVDKALTKLENIETPEERVSTEAGSVSFRTLKKFRILDKSKIPLEYMEPNEVAIRGAMGKGVEIDGVEYYEKQSIINKR